MNIFLSLFSRKHRAKKEIPITYAIGWWAFQDLLEIHTFDVSIINSHLNLFNSKSLIQYSVTGVLKQKDGYAPFIRSVHHSEDVLTSKNVFAEDEDSSLDAHIKITPVVGLKTSKESIPSDTTFSFTNRHVVSSLHWGNNLIRFSCGDFNQEICLKQRK